MKKFIILFLFLSLLSMSLMSCTQVEPSILSSVTLPKDKVEKVENGSSPSLMSGSNFGEIFRTHYRLGNFNDMVSMTASESVEKHGKENLLKFYESMNFGYDIRLLSMNRSGNSYRLNYEAYKYGTKGMFRLSVVKEMEEFKLVLPDNLDDFLEEIKVY